MNNKGLMEVLGKKKGLLQKFQYREKTRKLNNLVFFYGLFF